MVADDQSKVGIIFNYYKVPVLAEHVGLRLNKVDNLNWSLEYCAFGHINENAVGGNCSIKVYKPVGIAVHIFPIVLFYLIPEFLCSLIQASNIYSSGQFTQFAIDGRIKAIQKNNAVCVQI